MTSLKLLFAITPIFFAVTVHSQEVAPVPAACTEQFLLDYDSTEASFLEVGLAADSKVDEHSFRTSVVSALNSCHSFVARYVSIDSVTGNWLAGECIRTVSNEAGETKTMLVTPLSHKAECEYLQRLLDRTDLAREKCGDVSRTQD